MTARLLPLAMIAVGLALILISVARAAEPERTEGWQLEVCQPTNECYRRGKILAGPTACNLDKKSLANVLPNTTTVNCVQVKEKK